MGTQGQTRSREVGLRGRDGAGVATEGEAPEVVWKRACVVARSKWLVGRYVEAFEARGIKCFALERQGDEARVPGVRVATMHRVKGLEFDWVWLAGVNEGVVPPRETNCVL